jgi:multidrug transporter EmrE-like cation transporter
MFGFLIGFIMALNDILSFGLTKQFYLKKIVNKLGLILPMLLYSFQIPLFYVGLQTMNMTVLNIIWNLFSNILVTLVGIFYFHEKINGLKYVAIAFALSSLILFGLDTYINV